MAARRRIKGLKPLFLLCCILVTGGVGRWMLSSTIPSSSRTTAISTFSRRQGRTSRSSDTAETSYRRASESEILVDSIEVSNGEANGDEVDGTDLEEKGEEKDDSIFAQEDLLTVIVIALFLIAATLAFESMKHFLEESVTEDMEVILEKLFGELTILGFLAIVTFILTQTGVLEKISVKVFGEGEDEELLEYFESVHYSIFFIMVFFVIQVLIMIQEASVTERQWEELDALAKLPNSRISMSSVSESTKHFFKQTDNIFVSCFPQFRNRKIERAQMHVTFKALREEFLLERSLDDPFDPTPEDKRVDADFNFGRYLSLAQAYTLTRIVEVEDKTWFFFGLLVIAFYGICQLVGRHVEVIAWIVVGIGWGVFILNMLFERHMIAIRNQFIPKKFMTSESSQRYSSNPLGMKRGGGDEQISEEISFLVNTFDAIRKYELPGWCDVDIEKFRKSRNPLVRCLVGGNPNRQQALFIMDSYGPKLYFLILQSNLIFTGVYAGMHLLTFLPIVYELYSWPLFTTFAILAFLPVLGISYNKKRVVAALAQVSSIGAYRKPQIVNDVLLETKTRRVVRTFLMVHKMWYTARTGASQGLLERNGSAEFDRQNSFSSLEQLEVSKSFDALDDDHSGAISHDEFRALLNRLGAHVSDSDFRKMVATLDVDNDGEVTKEEFMKWYAKRSDADNMTLRERAKDIFGIFDQDNNGEITIGEFKTKLDALHMGFSVDEIGAIINELDRDRNGTVSEEEFEALLKKYYPSELTHDMMEMEDH